MIIHTIFSKKLNQKNFLIICLFAIGIIFAGCSKNTGTKENTKAATEPTARPLDSLNFQVEAASLKQVNLSWNKIRRATSYVISRERYKNDGGDPGEMVANSRIILARLSPDDTSYQDTTVKEETHYRYIIQAYCEYDELDEMEYEANKLEPVLVEGAMVQLAIGDADWKTNTEEQRITAPTSITLEVGLNSNSSGRIAPEGIEIYRGTSFDKMQLLTDLPITQDNPLEDYNTGIRYVDENVATGQTYFYQAKSYKVFDGTRVYGTPTVYLKKSAVLPERNYSMEFAQKKGENLSLEISLQSNIKGNATLQFISNQFNGLVDYIYQNEDESYHSVSMRLQSYKKGNKNWTAYQGQTLCLQGEEQINLRFEPIEEETLVFPAENMKSAEILLLVEYNSIERNLHFDLKQNQVFLTETYSETDKPTSLAETINASDMNEKGNRQNDSVPDVSSFKYSETKIGFTPLYTQANAKNCPDGVEIYRSNDNKNFSLAKAVSYPDYFSAAYSDSLAVPGNTYYYKARNYIDTETGRIYGKFTNITFHANYNTEKYKMWLAENPTENENSEEKASQQIIIGIYSYSLGNPTLHFDSSSASCKIGEEQFPFVIKEYSLDGIHWKNKSKEFTLSPKEMIYLKLEAEKNQKEFDWNNIDKIYISTDLEDASGHLAYNLTDDKSSYSVTYDD